MNELITAEEVKSLVWKRIGELGSQRAFAKEAKVSAPYVNDYLQGYRPAAKAILRAVGLEKVVMYRKR